jgi:hypothetical protein
MITRDREHSSERTLTDNVLPQITGVILIVEYKVVWLRYVRLPPSVLFYIGIYIDSILTRHLLRRHLRHDPLINNSGHCEIGSPVALKAPYHTCATTNLLKSRICLPCET